MKITDISLSKVAPLAIGQSPINITAQAQEARRLFRSLGLKGIGVRVYSNISNSGVEIRLLEDSTEDEANHMRQILRLAFANHTIIAATPARQALIWFVQVPRAARAARMAMAPIPDRERREYTITLKIKSVLESNQLLDVIAERIPARIIGGMAEIYLGAGPAIGVAAA
jgi:hypothetical protein